MKDHDEDMVYLAPSNYDKIVWTEEIAQPKPFLIPDDGGKVVETLPPEKENRKLRWADTVQLCEMPNRKQLGLVEDSEEEEEGGGEDDYEIEIVEDDGDADFYLEIVDGEIFYVFETEDDSDDDEEMQDADVEMQEGDEVMQEGDEENDDESEYSAPSQAGLQINFGGDSIEPEISIAAIIPSDEVDSKLVIQSTASLDPSSVQSQDVPQVIKTSNDVIMPGDQTLTGLEISKNGAMEVDANEDHEVGEGELSPGQSQDHGLPTPVPEVLSPPSSPNQTPKASLEPVLSPTPLSPTPTPMSPNTKRGILKSPIQKVPPSPKPPASPKPPQSPRRKKKQKTVTKTYVRADTFDGEHQVFTWEKPTWATETNLKETGKAEEMRTTGNLANPITFPKQRKKKDGADSDKHEVYEDEHGNVIDKEELIRRIQEGDGSAVAFVPKPTYGGRYQRKLKCSVQGQKIRSGIDLAKPITKATVDRKRDDINLIAQPDKVLRKHVSPVRRQYSWERPDWASKAKKGNAVALPKEAPITNIREVRKELASQQPEWVTMRLNKSKKGDAVKSGDRLELPITSLPHGTKDKRAVEKSNSSDMLPPLRPRESLSERGVHRSRSLDIVLPPPPLTDSEDVEQADQNGQEE